MLLIVELPDDNVLALDVDPTFSVADVLALIDIETPGLGVVALETRTDIYADPEFFNAQDSGTLADLFNFPTVFEVRAVVAEELGAESDDEEENDLLSMSRSGSLADEEWLHHQKPALAAPQNLLDAEGDAFGDVVPVPVEAAAAPRRASFKNPLRKMNKKKKAEARPTVRVTVRTLTGKTIALDAEAGETWAQTKARIFDREGIPPEQQRIIINGRQVADLERITADGGPVNANLVLRLRGGMPEPTSVIPEAVASLSSSASLDVTYLSAYGPEQAVRPKETFVLKLLAFADTSGAGAPGGPGGSASSLVQVGMHGPVLLQREAVYPVRLEFDETYFQCPAPEASLLWMGSQSTVSFAVTSIKQDDIRSHILTAVLTLPKGVQARVLFSVGVKGQDAQKPMVTPGDIFAAQNGTLMADGKSKIPLQDLRSLMVYMSRLASTSDKDRTGMQFAPRPPSLESSDDGPDQGSSDPTARRVLPQDFALRLPDKGKFDHDIFISYRRAQIDFADRLRLHLERFGYSVFLDVSDDHGLGAGDFRAQLDRAVKRSRVLMPLFTDAPSGLSSEASKLSSASLMAANHAAGVTDWCLEELRLASADPDMLIVPVYRENIDIGAEMAALPDGLERVKSSNALPIYDAVFGMCVRRIHRDIQDFFAVSEIFAAAPSKRLSQRLSRRLTPGRASATPARRDSACIIS